MNANYPFGKVKEKIFLLKHGDFKADTRTRTLKAKNSKPLSMYFKKDQQRQISTH